MTFLNDYIVLFIYFFILITRDCNKMFVFLQHAAFRDVMSSMDTAPNQTSVCKYLVRFLSDERHLSVTFPWPA